MQKGVKTTEISRKTRIDDVYENNNSWFFNNWLYWIFDSINNKQIGFIRLIDYGNICNKDDKRQGKAYNGNPLQ